MKLFNVSWSRCWSKFHYQTFKLSKFLLQKSLHKLNQVSLEAGHYVQNLISLQNWVLDASV